MINLKNIFKVKKRYDDSFKNKDYIPKITIFSGAGISRESGLLTFRDGDGLWNNFSVEEVASVFAIKKDISKVLDFYNQRRKEMLNAEPNEAHILVKELEKYFDVIVVTQNVDNLHEKAGSTKVLHLHGDILKSRPISNTKIFYPQLKDINIGDRCPITNSQLRPHIVLFGEKLDETIYYDSRRHIRESDIFIVTGTSLEVEPAASLVAEGISSRKFYIIDPCDIKPKYRLNFEHIKETSSIGLQKLMPSLILEADRIRDEKREH